MRAGFKKNIFVHFGTALAVFASVYGMESFAQVNSMPSNAFLAGHHAQKGVSCSACHTTQGVSDTESEINAQCVACHGPQSEIAKKTQAALNPHDSHLGRIQCTTCHTGHVESKAYCTNCHDFPQMEKMKFGKPNQKKDFAEDLSKYDKAVPTRVEKTDLLIIGSGAAGFSAAITAHEAGVKNLIMIEKMPISGGNSQFAAGGMNAAGTKYQAAKGIKDTAELMYQDTLKGGRNIANPELVRILSDESNASMEWLTKHGAILSHVGRGGGASQPRMHGVEGGGFVGPYLSQFFSDLAAKENIDLRLNTKLVKLIKDADGRISGALVKGKHTGLYQIDAKVVLLATGGIGANKPLVAELRPDLAKVAKTSNQPGSQGDGLILAKKVGASTVDDNQIQVNAALLVGSPVMVSDTVLGAGAIFVNREGKRFLNEMTTRDNRFKALAAQTGGTAFEVFDQQVRDKIKQTGAAVQLGLAKQGNTIEELAKNMNIDPKVLAETVNTYNGYVDAKKDPDFNRPSLPGKVAVAPFYAIEIAPAVHYYMGGLKINPQTEVIGNDGNVIPGLLAAGEVTGGVHGGNRLGGNSISETITFGRIAGMKAAKEILK